MCQMALMAHMSQPEGPDWHDETVLAMLELVQKAVGMTTYRERGPPPPSEGGPTTWRGHHWCPNTKRWRKPRAGAKLKEPGYGAMWRAREGGPHRTISAATAAAHAAAHAPRAAHAANAANAAAHSSSHAAAHAPTQWRGFRDAAGRRAWHLGVGRARSLSLV